MSEPERIDEAAINAALDGLVQNAAPGDASFAGLVAAAGKELQRRFDHDPDSLPGTFVIKLFLDGTKAIAANDGLDDTPDAPDPDVLDLVQNQGLPVTRRIELLQAERDRTVGRLAAIDHALEALHD